MKKPDKTVNTSSLADNPIPVMTLKKFAAETGLALAGPTVVNGMVQRKALPTVKIGKHRMIDMDALRLMLEKQRDSSC
ncbi:helix-turn-helix domain-containing protein [Marinospirillum minutulum]|uniref:helix-turn-helix domain-containing protein n=1 Tax=Marinospirillum minutulum TaxID=64974 RepID=UPI0003FE4F3A|nr:helix-turn-helix domain-containing protein [Marinospirillum minutulum]